MLSDLIRKSPESREFISSHLCELADTRCEALQRVNTLIFFLLQLTFVSWHELEVSGYDPEYFTPQTLLIFTFGLALLSLPLRVLELKSNHERKVVAKIVSPHVSCMDFEMFIAVSFEILLVFLQPNPFCIGAELHIWVNELSIYYSLQYNEILLALSLLKIIYYTPLQFFSSFFISKSSSGKRIFEMSNVSLDSNQLKLSISENPLLTIGIFYLTNLVIFAYIIRILEEKNPVYDFESMYNSIWFTFVTMSTVGYGDYVPSASHTKICAIFICMVGVMQNYMVTLIFLQRVNLNSFETYILSEFDRKVDLNELENELFSFMRSIHRVKYFISKAPTVINNLIATYEMKRLRTSANSIMKLKPRAFVQLQNVEEKTNKRLYKTFQNISAVCQFESNIKNLLGELETIIVWTSNF